LQLNLLPADPNRRYLERLLQFISDWEKKSETKKLAELVEYLGYFQEADQVIALEEEAEDDAVQLTTVHGAKGLEFACVFILRLSRGAFPANRRRPVLEFPVRLMKEALPEGEFHIQEERRLFYVALTRARDELTLTAVVNQRSKASPFLEDILLHAELAKRDVEQLAPAAQSVSRPAAPLFPSRTADARVYSRIGEWAQQFHPPVAEPLHLSASAIETYDRCPMKYLFSSVWGLEGGPQAAMTFGNVMHTTIKELVAQIHKGQRVTLEDVAAIYERNWSDAGFRDNFQREAYKKAGLEQLCAFFETYSAAPPRVLGQERTFELQMENNIVVTGRIDQINSLDSQTKQAEIVDYKTGTPKDEKAADKSLQLSLYALGAREVLGYDPVRLVLYNLTTTEAVTTTRDEKALAQARDTVQQVAADIRALHFPAKPGHGCRYCEYQPICPEHEQSAYAAPAGE
jgi:DNA helicase-2/ATP-dependent DNA helicase PcrA